MHCLDRRRQSFHNTHRNSERGMSNALDRLIYHATQQVRTAWYSAHYAAAMKSAPPVEPAPEGKLPGWRTIYRDLERLRRLDWQNVQDGLYPAPEPAVTALADQAKRSVAFFRDLGDVNRRRTERNGSEIYSPELRARYPRYYLQNFHYQSGGYLTEDSAELYDHQVEVLFVGGADAMRRQALAAQIRHMRTSRHPAHRHLDVACGTGRYLRFLKECQPRLRVAGIDLSRPYLERARGALRPWSRTSLTQANAETLPFADKSFDTLSCIFLFHELPAKVRPRVAAEMTRVLKPGGQLFFLDSIQRGDHAAYDTLLDRFPVAFHEPYYHDFVRADLDALFAETGLQPKTAERFYFAKLLTYQRPAAPSD